MTNIQKQIKDNMKRIRTSIVIALLCLCGTGAHAQDIKEILSGVVKTVIGDKATTKSSIVGTWKYSGPACEFESENFLSKAGGQAATTKINNTLAPIMKKTGINNVVFTINSDGTYTSSLKKYTTKGTYAFDETAKTITFKTSSGHSYTTYVVVTGSTMEMLFKADKLIEVLKVIGNTASSFSSSAAVVSTVLGKYNGMKVGFALKK